MALVITIWINNLLSKVKNDISGDILMSVV